MKLACSVLMVVMALHSECGATCLAEAFRSNAAPVATSDAPCHQHQQSPSRSHEMPQDRSGPCSQATIELKASATINPLQDCLVALPLVTPVTSLIECLQMPFSANHLPGVWSSAPSQLVLRI